MQFSLDENRIANIVNLNVVKLDCFMQVKTEFHFFLENRADLQFFQTSATYTNDSFHTHTIWFL